MPQLAAENELLAEVAEVILDPLGLAGPLPFETTGSSPRADSLGVSSSSWFQRGTYPNRNASPYHRFDSYAHLKR